MSWRIDFDATLGIIHCVYADHVSTEDYEAGTLKTIALAKKHKSNLILIDESELKTAAVSTLEIYKMPRFYEVADANRRSKWALIMPPGGKVRGDLEFYVTMCLNRGWYLKAFDDRQEAIDWLLSDGDDYRGAGGSE